MSKELISHARVVQTALASFNEDWSSLVRGFDAAEGFRQQWSEGDSRKALEEGWLIDCNAAISRLQNLHKDLQGAIQGLVSLQEACVEEGDLQQSLRVQEPIVASQEYSALIWLMTKTAVSRLPKHFSLCCLLDPIEQMCQ